MLIMMRADHRPEDVERVTQKIASLGFKSHILPGEVSVAIGITGNDTAIAAEHFQALPGVHDAIPVTKPFKLASRQFRRQDTEIKVGNVVIGPGRFVVIAGPCAVESEEQTLRIAHEVKKRGALILRGGAYKPRTSPYSFQGLGVEGLKILAKARQETGMPVVTEALDLEGLEHVYKYADIIQIGARNMQNFALLQAVGKTDKPVLLKRGMAATIDEWLMAAEYIMAQGNPNVILAERGVRSFDTHTRNMLDLTAVPVARGLSHLPVLVDPSHGTGKRDKVIPMAKASLAAGANAVMVDVHDRPHEALCDGPQAISPDEFSTMVADLRKIGRALDLEVP